MSVDFVKSKIGSLQLTVAQRQQAQLSYFTESSVQKEITQAYLEQWAQRKYANTDYFITWIKMIFREDNFMSFYKYLRYPLASARLIQDEIKPQLKRVFYSEDSYFEYTVKNKVVPCPEILNTKKFNETIFESLLFRFNDIIFTDIDENGIPFRDIISINDVVAIESKDSIINQLAFKAITQSVDGLETRGYLYANAKEYIVYNSEFKVISTTPHDLGVCPADYVSKDAYYSKDDVVRKSIFSYLREELEEYVFLKTLQRMTEPNGAIPVVTIMQTNEVKSGGDNIKSAGASQKEPMSAFTVGQQQAKYGSQVTGSDSVLQTGSIIKVPSIKDANGVVDMSASKDFMTFHHHPVDSLVYMNNRIKEIKASIITACLGDYHESTRPPMNELQVQQSYINKADKLRYISNCLSWIRNQSDYKLLAMQYGPNTVTVQNFFGSDFFMEAISDLYALFKNSPNPIESKNILVRLSKNRNRFNKEKSEKETILYNLLPYASNTDFATAMGLNLVDPFISNYQTRFMYWIEMFEAEFGDLVEFWNSLGDEKTSVKIVLINNLIKQIIINETATIHPPESVQGQRS